jgi:hypothetical protein
MTGEAGICVAWKTYFEVVVYPEISGLVLSIVNDFEKYGRDGKLTS